MMGAPCDLVKKNEDARSPRPRTKKSAARGVGFATTRTARVVEEDVASFDPESEADRARSARRNGEPRSGRDGKHETGTLRRTNLSNPETKS